MDFTSKQTNKLKKLAKIMDEGNEGVSELLVDVEDRIEEITITLNEVISKANEAVSIAEQTSKQSGAPGYTPIKGVDYEDGHDYVLTEIDKKEIASKIKVPIVEKVIEKTEVIREQPIVREKEIIKETIKEPQIINEKLTGEEIVYKINDLPVDDDEQKIDASHIKNLPRHERVIERIGGGGISQVYHDTNFTGSGTQPDVLHLNPNISINSVQFNTTATPLTNAEGLLQWNATDGTLDLGMDGGDITLQIGQEMFTKVRNVSGSTIPNGSLVYFSGRTGNRPNIYLARGNVEATAKVVGMATTDIAHNSDGFITTMGYVRQIDTRGVDEGETWADGDVLWTSTTLAGHATNVEPSAPHHSDKIGYVGVAGNVGIGSVLLDIDMHLSLEELSDVNGTALTTTGQFPVWNQTAGYFDFDHNISEFGGGSGWTVATPTGTVDSSNASFTVTAEPKCVISDGMTYFDGAGYTYAALSITLDIPPSSFIRYFY